MKNEKKKYEKPELEKHDNLNEITKIILVSLVG